ncbi:glycosyltransferase family 4 protein [Hyunsoonleella pacifica]|uniref:Glycosyltransferase family 1 protein n=1 Tax=Hyunsoonleella pacifica TaxID=1080224 RepID=A0A4V2JB75_9FLAO|nr:glycosyltransferase family 4 protein [Hyunsoonleella pacifica]TBN17658.1 glycosyltransferase family 1 protein [Hyunsoonleella pacifica]GGD10081.1 galacturonosyl transferase [Hyunsoonleella pacifica]
MKKKIIRVTTVPESLGGLLTGQLNFMSQYFDVVGISSTGNESRLLKVGKDEGVRVIPVEMTRKITPMKDLKAVWKLYKIFKKEKPYIVHSHTPKAGTLSMLAALIANVPHRLHTIAGLPLVEATGFKRLILNTVEKITYRCATKIYPNSYGLVDIILKHKFTSKKKLRVIGKGSSNGIDTNHFNPLLYNDSYKIKLRKQLKIPDTSFIFIFLGRLVADKGLNELIKAFSKLNKEFSDTKLLLVGGYERELDPLSPDSEHIINTNNNIITTGWVNDVRPYFSISNALTFPSYREGFPNVLMQAAAMELVSIVTNINGCNEIINHGKNGIIIPVKNDEALYNAMIQVYNNKSASIVMGKASRKIIVSNYKRTEVWNALLKEYNSLS